MSIGAAGGEMADALGLDREAIQTIQPPTGPLPWSSRLPVATLATDSVSLASLAMNLASTARSGADPAPVRIDSARVAASFGSERLLRIDGAAPSVWAPLSGFWMTADGWVRTHANYKHHERALRTLLRVGEDAGESDMATALENRSAEELEDRAARSGAVIGAVRPAEQWRDHAHGHLLSDQPFVHRTRAGDAPPRPWTTAGALPLSGVRVLDLTRVIAGPVAARDLAFAGADVLRVDSPRLEETGWIHLDTGQGKRSTLLDLRERPDREIFESLLSRADVLLTGYRPGALTRFGLDPATVAERHPGLVTASVSAWGTTGPWAERRGFDSIVQAVSGIAMTESVDGTTPGALPVQALDHATGHFLAAAIVHALIEQRRDGGSGDVRMSLARTAHALLRSTDQVTTRADDAVLPVLERRRSGTGSETLTYAPPVLAFAGAPSDYREIGRAWGADAAAWVS